MASGTLEGGIIPKLGAAIAAARAGVPAYIGRRRCRGMSVLTGTPLLPHLRALPGDVRRRRGLLADRRRRAALPRPGRRHRRRQPRPLPSGAARGRAGAARAALARLEPLLDRADGEPGAAAVGPLRRRARVLLQLRHRGGRGRDQVGAQVDRQDGARRARGLVPRPDDGRALDHRPAEQAGAVRAARARRRASRRPRRSRRRSGRRPPRSSSSPCRARAA